MEPEHIFWVCSGCGGSAGIEVIEGATSLDDRYTIGYCVVCTPPPKPKQQKGVHTEVPVYPPRKTIALVRRDAWDPAKFSERLEHERRRKLVDDYGRGRIPKEDPRHAEALALVFGEGAE